MQARLKKGSVAALQILRKAALANGESLMNHTACPAAGFPSDQ